MLFNKGIKFIQNMHKQENMESEVAFIPIPSLQKQVNQEITTCLGAHRSASFIMFDITSLREDSFRWY